MGSTTFEPSSNSAPRSGSGPGPVRVHKDLLRSGLCLLLALLLASCSSTRFAYNRLDFILPWYAQRYVDLDRDPADELDARLKPLLAWHRREELPRYVAVLDGLLADLQEPLTVSLLDAYLQRADRAWQRMRDPALESLLELAEGLSDEQLAEFIDSLEKKQGKYERKYLDRSDREFVEDAGDSLEESLEDYLGRLDREQRERLRRAARELKRADSNWLRERAAWIAEMESELARAPGWKARVTSLVRDWEANLDPASAALYAHNREVVLAAVADVVNTRSERQDDRLRSRLGELRDELASLIPEGAKTDDREPGLH